MVAFGGAGTGFVGRRDARLIKNWEVGVGTRKRRVWGAIGAGVCHLAFMGCGGADEVLTAAGRPLLMHEAHSSAAGKSHRRSLIPALAHIQLCGLLDLLV